MIDDVYYLLRNSATVLIHNSISRKSGANIEAWIDKPPTTSIKIKDLANI
jgi:hypothetical protein